MCLKRSRIVAALVAIGLATGMATSGAAPAAAGEHDVADWLYEVKAGLLYHDMDYLWSNLRLERGVDFNGEVIFAPALRLFGGAFRGALGASVNSDGGTSKAYLDLRYMYEFDSGIFVSTGGGGAVHNGELTSSRSDRKALGSRVLFHIPVEAGYRFTPHQSVSIYYDHISNAGLAENNEGLDTLGLRYGYRFSPSAP